MFRPTVCLDLDGVLAHYDGWKGIEHIGEPIAGAVQFTKELSKFCKITIFTTRCKEYLNKAPAPPGAAEPDRRPAVQLVQIIANWLNQHGFFYDTIYAEQGKPFGVAYIDDRAVCCRPQDSATPDFEYQFALAAIATLCDSLRRKDVSKVAMSGG